MSITLVSRGTALLALTIIALVLAIPTRSASQDIVGEATTDSPGRTIFTKQGRTFETIDDMIIELAGPGLLSVELKDVRKWPNGRLPIAFSENYSEAEKAIFFEACQWWSDVSKVECVPRSNETNYIFVNAHASVNNSYLGMIGGKQTLNLVSRGNRAVIAHELAHALGFSHQHNAPNRNSFVAILWNNIKTGRKHNFRMIPPAKAIVFGDYDYCSVMHYSTYAFSRNQKPTIDLLGAAPPCRVGQRSTLSRFDKFGMAAAYGADADDEKIAIVPDIVANFADSRHWNGSSIFRNHGVRTQLIEGDLKTGCTMITNCERLCEVTKAIWQYPEAGTAVPFGVVVSLKSQTGTEFDMLPPPTGQICQ